MEVMGIDLGSNTLRIVVRDCKKNVYTQVFEQMVKTADGLIQTGHITPEAVERIVQALAKADEKLDFKHKSILAVTTAAMRQASNSHEAIETIFQKSGIRFEIIGADKEAELTHLAVKRRLDSLGKGNEAFFLLDIGGGSTEVIYSFQGVIRSLSFDVGIVTMSQKYPTKEALLKGVYEAFAPLKVFISKIDKKAQAKTLVATAGTPTTMASLKLGMTVKSYDPAKINGTLLDLDDLDKGLDKLMKMSASQRELHVGVGRDTLIMAGVEILKALYEMLGFTQAIVVDDGLAEGVALAKCLQNPRL